MTRELRELVIERDGNVCRYCGEECKPYLKPHGWNRVRKMSGVEIDHVIPKSRGGTDDLDNLVVSCAPCNRRKYAKVWVPA